MSDHLVRTYNDCDGSSGQSMQSYHSLWMSHWTRRICKEEIPNHSCSSSSFMNQKSCQASNQHLVTNGKGIEPNSCPANGLGEIKSGCSDIKTESSKMTATSTGVETRKFQSLPADSPCRKEESTSNRKGIQATSDVEAIRAHQSEDDLDFDPTKLSLRCYVPPLLSVAPDADKTLSKECHIKAEGMLQNTKEHVDACSFFGDSNFAIPRPISKGLNISSTDMVQRGHGQGNEGISFFPSQMSRPALAPEEQLPQTNRSFAEHENLDSLRQSTFLVRENKAESHSKSGRSLTSYQQQNKASTSKTDPASGREQFQDTKSASGINMFWNQSNHPGATRSDNLYNVSSSVHKFPTSLQDLESMRICTTLDTVVPRGAPPGFSQTTHSLLITKRTDLKFEASFRNLRESAQSDGNAFLQLCGIPPLFGSGSQGVKIQSLGSSTDSEGKENVGDPSVRFVGAEVPKASENSVDGKGKRVVCDPDQKNESSADTDTMDLTDLKEQNPHLSVNSSPSSKLLKLSLVTPQPAFGSSSIRRQPECKLPVVNLELPALPAPNNGDASSSRTESLDMETLFKHAEPVSQSKSDWSHGRSAANPEPSRRWIKRLKSSASEPHAVGTKYTNVGERSCHEKSSQGKSLTGWPASSEPTVNEFLGKEMMVPDKTTTSVRAGESSSVGTTGEVRDIPTSQSWIQRWCRGQFAATPQKKLAATVISVLAQSPKLPCEDLREKQFPSIAAMALMGKAMRGFQPCELERKGSVMVWNNRGF